MSNKETSTLDRLSAADPALAVTDDELARSREKSLAFVDTDTEHIALGGSIRDFHQQPSRRRVRVAAGFGLLAAAAAAIVAGFFVASSISAEVVQQAAPAAKQPDGVLQSGSPDFSPLPEITDAKAPTGASEIVTGGNGNKVAVSKDQDVNVFMDALNTGQLGLNTAGCFSNVAVDGSSGGLIFPFGTTVTESGVVLPDGTSINIGQEFAFGGGSLPGSADLAGCFINGEAFLVQSWDALP